MGFIERTCYKEIAKDKEKWNMESRIEKTLELRAKGYNCCQAVACAYCDLVGMEEDMMFRIAEGFGGGMGDMQGTCGAVSGAVLLAGMKNSGGKDLHNTKTDTQKLSKAIRAAFTTKNTSVICKDLKGIETGKVIRTCPECITDAAGIAEMILFSEK